MKISYINLHIVLILFIISVSLAQETEYKDEHSHKSGLNVQKVLLKYLPKNPMVAALSSVIYITMTPLILLKFLPSNLPKSLLNALLAFALGTVLGDVFLHMIPSLMTSHSEGEIDKLQHSYENDNQHMEHLIDIGILMLTGIITFYVLEKLVNLFGGECSQDQVNEEKNNYKYNHRRHNDFDNKQEYADKIFSSKNDDQYFGEDEMNNKSNKNNALKKRKPLKKRERENSTTFITNKTIEKGYQTKINCIKNVSNSSYTKAFVQVMASMTHGFTDGLSVTFAFISSPSAGLTTAFAMFLHEIPHKFGDYTIMRQLGFSSRKAILMQFISALGTLLGSITACIIFWMPSSISSISITDLCNNYIMPITTGSLVYLALVGMLPELINYKPKGFLKSLVQIIVEVVFFGLGVYIMKYIALNE